MLQLPPPHVQILALPSRDPESLERCGRAPHRLRGVILSLVDINLG